LKFQAVAEKTAKDARGLLYFAAPGRMETFWYRLTQVHLEKQPLKWRESVCVCI